MVLLLQLQGHILKTQLFTNVEREDASLDINIQLILVESLDSIMYNHVSIVKMLNIFGIQLKQLMKGQRKSERTD